MKIKLFIKDKFFYIVSNIIVTAFISLLLLALRIDAYAIIFVVMLNLLVVYFTIAYEFLKKKSFYKIIHKQLENLDKKFLLSEIINEPNFLEGQILFEILQKTNKSMNDEIAKYKISSEEYREYIEMWVHEVKTPIASSKLIIENNKNSITKSINEELNKIEGFVEQTLFYSKSNSVEKDYIIKELSLRELVNSVIKKNAKALIENKVGIELKGIDYIIYSDSKWSEFILNQIIGNAIKYLDKADKKIIIKAEENTNNITLCIIDNGIGMSDKDVVKVFEKGFTGEVGRKYSQASGIGLYLCKKLCNKLGLGINLKSKLNKGTTVSLIFPKNKMITFE